MSRRRTALISLSAAIIGLLVACCTARAEEQKSLSASAEKSCEHVPQADLEKLCAKAWQDSALRKLRERNPEAFKKYTVIAEQSPATASEYLWQVARKPRFVCDQFVDAAYADPKHKNLALPLNHLRASVDGQKDVVAGRLSRATHHADWMQVTIVVLGSLVTLVGAATAAFASTPTSPAGRHTLLGLKIAVVVLPIILTAVTSMAAFFDLRGIAISESRASIALNELQSQIEEAVITGCVRTEALAGDASLPLTISAIQEWQGRLSAILRQDADTYVKRREAVAPH